MHVGRLVVNGDVLLRLQTSATCPLHRYLSRYYPSSPQAPLSFCESNELDTQATDYQNRCSAGLEIAESWPNLDPKLSKHMTTYYEESSNCSLRIAGLRFSLGIRRSSPCVQISFLQHEPG
jgi:hypothetical protein